MVLPAEAFGDDKPMIAQFQFCHDKSSVLQTEEGVCLDADDPQLAEFLQLMQPRRAGTIWSNDDMAPGPTPKQPPAALPAVTKPASLKVCKLTCVACCAGDAVTSYCAAPPL